LQFYHKETSKKKTTDTFTFTIFFLFFFFFYIHTTNNKNSKKKLNKNYIKQFKNYKTTLKRSWRHMGSRAAADEGGKTGGLGMSSSSLSPYASGDLQNNQKHHMQLILIFFLCFQSFFLSSSPFWICFPLCRSVLFFFFPNLLCFR